MKKKSANPTQNTATRTAISATAAPTPPEAQHRWAYGLLVVVLPLLVYFQTTNFGFSYHDDDVILLDGAKTLAQPFSFERIFLTDAWLRVQQIELYRPLQSLSFWIDFQWFGTAPAGYHWHNLLLHLLNCFLVFALLRLVLQRIEWAALGALIWGLNFLNTHAVCWVPARGDLLLGTYGLLFLISFIKWLKTNHLGWAVLNIFAFAMALLAKENAILLPFFAVATYFFHLRTAQNLGQKNWIKTFSPALAWSVFALIYFNWRSRSIAVAGENLSLNALFKNIRVLPESFFKWLVPMKFSVMAGFDAISLMGGLLLLFGALYFTKKFVAQHPNHQPHLWWAGSILLLPLLPSLLYAPQFVAYGYDYLDHRMYFPSVGLAFLLVLLLGTQAFFQKNTKIVLTAAAVYFGAFAFIHAKNYQNFDTYYQNAMRTNPRSGLALTNYGILKRKAGDRATAEKLFEKALAIAPNYDFLQAEMAVLQNENGNHAQALKLLDQLLQNPARVRTERDVVLCHRGFARAKMGKPAEAVEDFKNAIALNPNVAQYYQNLGSCYEDLEQSEAAIEAYSKAVQLQPDAVQCWYRRAFQYGKTGQPQKALSDLERAIALQPGRGEFYYFKAMAYKDLNDRDKYCENMKRAAALKVPEAAEPAARFCAE